MIEQLSAIIDRTGIIDDARTYVVPALIAAAWRARLAPLSGIPAANIVNPHTRRASSRAVSEFMARCEGQRG